MNMPTKQKLDTIRKDMQDALDAIAKKNGIDSIRLGTMRYDDSGFKIPVEAVFEGGDTKELKLLKQRATFLGFNDSIVNAVIKYAKKDFKVVGLRSTKLVIEDMEGKSYVAKIDDILNVLKASNSEHIKQEKTFTP